MVDEYRYAKAVGCLVGAGVITVGGVGEPVVRYTVMVNPLLLLQLTQSQKFVWNRKPNVCPEGMITVVACTLCSGAENMYCAEVEDTLARETSAVVVAASTICIVLVNVPEP